MHDVAAAVGIHQLARLDGWIDRRRELADALRRAARRACRSSCRRGRRAGRPPRAPPLHRSGSRDDAPLDRDARRRARCASATSARRVHFRADPPALLLPRPPTGCAPEDLPVAADWSRARAHAAAVPGDDRRTTSTTSPRRSRTSLALSACAALALAALAAVVRSPAARARAGARPHEVDLGPDRAPRRAARRSRSTRTSASTILQHQLVLERGRADAGRRTRATPTTPPTAGREQLDAAVAEAAAPRHPHRADGHGHAAVGERRPRADLGARRDVARLRRLPRRRRAALPARAPLDDLGRADRDATASSRCRADVAGRPAAPTPALLDARLRRAEESHAARTS